MEIIRDIAHPMPWSIHASCREKVKASGDYRLRECPPILSVSTIVQACLLLLGKILARPRRRNGTITGDLAAIPQIVRAKILPNLSRRTSPRIDRFHKGYPVCRGWLWYLDQVLAFVPNGNTTKLPRRFCIAPAPRFESSSRLRSSSLFVFQFTQLTPSLN